MFMFTAKFNKKTAILSVLILGIILCAIILLVGNASKSTETASLSHTVKDNDDRISYLKSFGWNVSDHPIEEQTIIIPSDFSDVYSAYNDIQIAQGFDLGKYGGIEAVRYTYEVLNYPNHTERIVADIIVYRNKVIAGDIQSTALDGFMHGLEYPKQ